MWNRIYALGQRKRMGFAEVQGAIKHMPYAEKLETHLHWLNLKNQFLKQVRPDEGHYRQLKQQVLIAEAHQWRSKVLEQLAHLGDQETWYQRLFKKPSLQLTALLGLFQAATPFHHHRTQDVLTIIKHYLPALTPGPELEGLKQALAATLLLRLEAGCARGNLSYDDAVVYVAERVAYVREAPLSPPLYQRHDWNPQLYLEAMQFLYQHQDIKIGEQAVGKRLQVFTSYHGAHQPFPTTPIKINGIEVAVPVELKSFIPQFQFLPAWLFQGTHLRAHLFYEHAFLLAQLKMPLPDVDSISLTRSDHQNLSYHPALLAFEQRRRLLETACNELESKKKKLYWYQAKSKHFISQYQTLLVPQLNTCRQQELRFLEIIRYEVYPHKKSLTTSHLHAMQETLNSFNHLHAVWVEMEQDPGYGLKLQETEHDLMALQEQSTKGMRLIVGEAEHEEPDVSLLSQLDLEAVCERSIIERAKQIKLVHLSQALPAEIAELISALSDQQPLSLEMSLAQITLYLYQQGRDQEEHQLKAQEEQLLRLQRELETLLELRSSHEQHLFSLLDGCKQVPLSHFLPLAYQQKLEQIKNIELVCLAEQKKEMLLELSKILKELEQEALHKHQHLMAYQKALGPTDKEVLAVALEREWEQLRDLLLLDEYACVLSRLEVNVIALVPQHPLSVANKKLFVEALSKALTEQIEENHVNSKIYTGVYHTLLAILRSLQNSYGTSAEELKAYADFELTCQGLNQEKLVSVASPVEQKLEELGQFQVDAESVSFLSSLNGVDFNQISAEVNHGQEKNKLVLSMLAAVSGLLKEISLLSTASEAKSIRMPYKIATLLCLGGNIRNLGDNQAKKQLDLLLRNFWWAYCKRWQCKDIDFYHQQQISAVQEPIFLELQAKDQDPYHWAALFKARSQLLGAQEEMERWQSICQRSARGLVQRRIRALLKDISLLRSRCYHQLLQQSSHPHDVTLLKLGKRMLALGISDVYDPQLALSERERLLFSVKSTGSFIRSCSNYLNRKAHHSSSMRKNMSMQPLMQDFVHILKMQQDVLAKDPVISMERLDEIEEICEAMKTKEKISLVQDQQLSNSSPSLS